MGDQRGERAEQLPSFTDPPVREVGVAVMTSGLGLGHVHLGLLWDQFRDDFPDVEIHHEVPQQIEFLGGLVEPVGVQFELMDAPPVPRAWFISSDQSDLVQVQADRVGFNWRRVGSGSGPYPRYAHVRAGFVAAYDKVLQFVEEHGLAKSPEPVQCEVLYVNEIPAMGTDRHGDPDPVLRLWTPVSDVYPGPAEDVRFSTRHRLPMDERSAGGRLVTEVTPVVRGGRRVYLLTLTVRGAPAGRSVDDVTAFIDMGHEIIVQSFASITTPGMHDEWGREQ